MVEEIIRNFDEIVSKLNGDYYESFANINTAKGAWIKCKEAFNEYFTGNNGRIERCIDDATDAASDTMRYADEQYYMRKSKKRQENEWNQLYSIADLAVMASTLAEITLAESDEVEELISDSLINFTEAIQKNPQIGNLRGDVEKLIQAIKNGMVHFPGKLREGNCSSVSCDTF